MQAKDDETPIWGVAAIAAELNTTPRRCYYMLARGYLPAEKVGAVWVSTRGRLRARIAPPAEVQS